MLSPTIENDLFDFIKNLLEGEEEGEGEEEKLYEFIKDLIAQEE
jgi:hypothetical protein